MFYKQYYVSVSIYTTYQFACANLTYLVLLFIYLFATFIDLVGFHIVEKASLSRVEFLKTDLRNSYWCDSKIETSEHKFQFQSVPDVEASNEPMPTTLIISAWETRIEAFSRADADTKLHPG